MGFGVEGVEIEDGQNRRKWLFLVKSGFLLKVVVFGDFAIWSISTYISIDVGEGVVWDRGCIRAIQPGEVGLGYGQF